jgi:LSD1 subclass zinc finger protein
MGVRVECPECETPLAIPERARGRSVRCSVCASIFRPGADGAADQTQARSASEGDQPARIRPAPPPAPPMPLVLGVCVILGLVVLLAIILFILWVAR